MPTLHHVHEEDNGTANSQSFDVTPHLRGFDDDRRLVPFNTPAALKAKFAAKGIKCLDFFLDDDDSAPYIEEGEAFYAEVGINVTFFFLVKGGFVHVYNDIDRGGLVVCLGPNPDFDKLAEVIDEVMI